MEHKYEWNKTYYHVENLDRKPIIVAVKLVSILYNSSGQVSYNVKPVDIAYSEQICNTPILYESAEACRDAILPGLIDQLYLSLSRVY